MSTSVGVIVPASLVLTVLNEASSLPSFFAGLARQNSWPAEIVVVDGGSSDRTVEILREWAPPPRVELVIVSSPGANISEGRNIAIQKASNEIILVTDAGTTLSEDWVSLLYSTVADGADVASGFFAPAGSTVFQRSLARIILPVLDEIRPETFLPSSRSVAFRREVWSAAGKYPEWLDYCEDLVFDVAAQESGARFQFVPDATATWDARPSVRAFARQYFRYARGDGKAGLWTKRHVLRYGAYGTGVVLLALPSTFATILGLIGFVVYLSKSWRRVIVGRSAVENHLGRTLALVPVVVVIGDVSKMAGYPAGIWWRHRRSR